jgi:hypothetical protein
MLTFHSTVIKPWLFQPCAAANDAVEAVLIFFYS